MVPHGAILGSCNSTNCVACDEKIASCCLSFRIYRNLKIALKSINSFFKNAPLSLVFTIYSKKMKTKPVYIRLAQETYNFTILSTFTATASKPEYGDSSSA